MEYLLSRNYGHFIVSDCESGEFVSVLGLSGSTSNIRFAGVIQKQEALEAHITRFRFNPSYMH